MFDTVTGDTSCSTVVDLDWHRWLWISEFFETHAQGAGFFTIVVEEGCKFRFGNTVGKYFLHHLAVIA